MPNPTTEDARPRAVPGILIFIAADIASFILFFSVFMTERAKQAEVFSSAAATLDRGLGLLNTVILLTSGWLVALTVDDLRRDRFGGAWAKLIAGIVIGSGFGAVKLTEYSEKIRDGMTPGHEPFFIFYFVLTGVHLLHYLIGMIALLAILSRIWGRKACGDSLGWIQGAALYWHMVDLLWIFLFPLLYLQGW